MNKMPEMPDSLPNSEVSGIFHNRRAKLINLGNETPKLSIFNLSIQYSSQGPSSLPACPSITTPFLPLLKALQRNFSSSGKCAKRQEGTYVRKITTGGEGPKGKEIF
jgi:hypothetical protein